MQYRASISLRVIMAVTRVFEVYLYTRFMTEHDYFLALILTKKIKHYTVYTRVKADFIYRESDPLIFCRNLNPSRNKISVTGH